MPKSEKRWAVVDADGDCLGPLMPIRYTEEEVWFQAASSWAYIGMYSVDEAISRMIIAGYTVRRVTVTPEDES